MIDLLMGVMLAGAALYGAPAGACELIAADEIRTVQGASLTGRKASAGQAHGRRFFQCFYSTADFVRSVSLTVITADTSGYWRELFHSPATPASTRKKAPPRAIDGLGDEAFWTSDARAGALYVLQGTAILRISVGGVADEEERLRRTRVLAQAALRRLQTGTWA